MKFSVLYHKFMMMHAGTAWVVSVFTLPSPTVVCICPDGSAL